MSKENYQKEVGLVTVRTRQGMSLEDIIAKSKLSEDEVKTWYDRAKKNM